MKRVRFYCSSSCDSQQRDQDQPGRYWVRYSKPIFSPALAYRRALLRKIQKRALQDLRSVVPSLRNRQKPDEATIVREAARYIDQLEATVLARLNSGSLNLNALSASQCHSVSVDDLKRRFMIRHSPQLNHGVWSSSMEQRGQHGAAALTNGTVESDSNR